MGQKFFKPPNNRERERRKLRNLKLELQNAILNKDLLRIKKLLTQGALPNAKEEYFSDKTLLQLILHHAVTRDETESDFEVIKFLLECGASPNAPDSEGLTPFHRLVEYGSMRVIELFLNSNAEYDIVDSNGENLLFPAIRRHKNEEVLRFLIDLGLNVNQPNNEKKTPLDVAACNGNPLKVEMLLSSGAHVNSNYCNNSTPLHLATDRCEIRFEIAEILIKNGADLNYRDESGRTPLHYLVENGSVEIIRFFLYSGADLNVLNKKGQNLLTPAVLYNENVNVVQLLVDLGLDVDHQDNAGKTPLHCTCETIYVDLEMMKCLLRNGANMNIADKEGHTPLTQAAQAFSSHNRSTRLFDDKKILNFMLEHTDLKEVHSDVNISTVDDRNCRDMWKLVLVKHLGKLQALDISVHPKILNMISGKKVFHDYYEWCKLELSRAKKTRFKNCWITYFDLLVANRRRLKNYAGNVDLINNFIFRGRGCLKKFPIYRDSIYENVNKGLRTREFYNKSCIILSECLPIFHPNHLIIRDVLDCILSKKDLIKFCKCK